MPRQNKKYAENLLNVENEHLKKLNQIVTDSVKEEELLIQEIAQKTKEQLTFAQRIADKVARFGGSWRFIIIFGIVLVAWIVINELLPASRKYDPYPFILLNLILSCVAAMQAPVSMMSQNRQEDKDRKQAENDYMINLKSEIEIRTLHQKMDLLMQEQFLKLMECQAEQIKLLQQMLNKLPGGK
jgi:uncharacterized membrane protein